MEDKQGDYPHSLPVIPEEKIIKIEDPLTLEEEDDKLISIVDDYVTGSKGHFSKIRLRDRQNRNYANLWGRENNTMDSLLNKKNVYSDNVIYEIESTLKPLATSKDPDILVYPAGESPEQQETADQLTLALQHAINVRELKDVKALAFKHLPVYFIGAVKYFWNPKKGKNGDIDFRVVHPQNLILDDGAKTKNVKQHRFLGEYIEVSVQDLIMRFPGKEEELLNQLVSERKIKSPQDPGALATRLKIIEMWFKYYEKKGDKWTEINAVLWKYNNLLFKKSKNPNWDWEGETHYFNFDDEIEPQQMISNLAQGNEMPGFESKQIFYNYFDEPEFPYILIGYDQWGNMVYDESSRIEQIIRLQENVDTRGNQIKKMLNRAMGKHIFSTEANLKAEDLEEMNWENMDQAIIVDGDINKTHAMAAADQPSPQIIQDYGNTRQIMFQKSHTNAITGALQSSTATSNQIAREANFSYADDLVDATINFMSEQMARAYLQLIKLRYTEEHFVRLIGKDGKVLFQKLHRDMIQDGMEVTITASGVDKLQRQNQAMDMAKLKLIDPLSFFEDIGTKNAQERTKRLLSFLNDPAQYQAEYVMGAGTPQEQAQMLNGTQGNTPPTPQGADAQQATLDIQQIMQGQIPQVPEVVDPTYAEAFAQFLQSPEFKQLPPEMQQQVLQYVQQVQQVLEQSAQGAAQQAPQQFGSAGAPQGGQLPVRTNPQQPSPQNTSVVPTAPPTGAPVGSPRG